MNARILTHRRIAIAHCGVSCVCAARMKDASFACPSGKFSAWYGEDGAPAPVNAPRFIKSNGFDGSHLWAQIHTLALTNSLTPAHLDRVAEELPPCCLHDWLEDVKANSLPLVNQFEWSVDRHNAVNARLRARALDRPDMSLSQAHARWSPP